MIRRPPRSPLFPYTPLSRFWPAPAIASLVAARAYAQGPVTITGKVTSDAGLPLGQVEVALPTLGLGALSKDDGSYTLVVPGARDRKSTRLNSSHSQISYAVFCLKKKKKKK